MKIKRSVARNGYGYLTMATTTTTIIDDGELNAGDDSDSGDGDAYDDEYHIMAYVLPYDTTK